MMWKVIGQSVIGSSHIQSGKLREDSLCHKIIKLSDNEEVLICFVSDGAGSAKYAAKASEVCVKQGVSIICELLAEEIKIDRPKLFELAEKIFSNLKDLANQFNEPIREFSCTLLGFVIFPGTSYFLQIGDGAIIRGDKSGYFSPIFWPQNGEYQNTTTFLVDDPNLGNLKTAIIEDTITEVAIFTDGIQTLALNNEFENVHQPFFNDLFKWLRKANNDEHISILNNKLKNYLSGDIITSRTDDDKTLLLASKIRHDTPSL